MELYKVYPRLCTFWCFIEILFYAGQLFGWSSILYVLKQEGFYIKLCTDIDKNHVATNETEIVILHTNETLNRKYFAYTELPYIPLDRKYSAYTDLPYIPGGKDLSVTIAGNGMERGGTFKNSTEHELVDKHSSENSLKGCHEQDARLNLWFSVAICVSYVMCSVMGPILQKVGMRCFRLIFL